MQPIRVLPIASATALSLCLGPVQISAQERTAEPETAALGCDRAAIRWFKPGEFELARGRAEKEKRLLIIKGISFGVDDAGAQCATKGMW